jgi:hypothetical protein
MGSTGFFGRFFGGFTSFFRWFFHRKLAILIFLLLLLALPAYVYYVTVYIPTHTPGYMPANSTGENRKDTLEIPGSLDQATLDTVRLIGTMELEKAYIKNRLALSQTDSVYMGIDLKNKQVNLEIKGVVVRTCPIVSAEISKRLHDIGHDQLLDWISTPFDLKGDLSTISKIPYVIKAAPKDTLEAQAQSSIPKSVDTTAVLFTLYFNRNLVVEIEQSEELKPGDLLIIAPYNEIKDKEYRQQALQAAMRFRPPVHEFYIRLKVSAADARAIYRGIPVHATMALRLQ